MNRRQAAFPVRYVTLASLAMFCLALIVAAAALHAQTGAKSAPSARRTTEAAIEVYESADGGKQSLVEQAALRFAAGASAAPAAVSTLIRVDDLRTYQQIDGLGASFTDASAWLFMEKLTPEQRASWMKQLFDRKSGIGLGILRQPMGSSDFSTEDTSYDDMPPGESDPQLAHFSIDRDRRYILPVLREALAINPNLKIIASPWSAPAWMKSSGSMILGSLLPSSYDPFARYFVRFVQAYEAAGVPIFAVTPQNEPRNLPKDYPAMAMTDHEQTVFVRDHLGPAFRQAGLKTKILVFDHNWDMIDYPETILSDGVAAQFVAGTAVHCYGGFPEAQSRLHDRFPYKDIWLTECSGGGWQTGNLLVEGTGLIIHTLRNWSKSVVLWNLALDQNYGPHLGGCKNCRAVLTIDHSTSPATVTPTADFTALAHVSKFVEPGAFRIDSTSVGAASATKIETSPLEHVAFRNPDGSIVLLVLNPSEAPVTFAIDWQGQQAPYTMKPQSAATFRWQASR